MDEAIDQPAAAAGPTRVLYGPMERKLRHENQLAREGYEFRRAFSRAELVQGILDWSPDILLLRWENEHAEDFSEFPTVRLLSFLGKYLVVTRLPILLLEDDPGWEALVPYGIVGQAPLMNGGIAEFREALESAKALVAHPTLMNMVRRKVA